MAVTFGKTKLPQNQILEGTATEVADLSTAVAQKLSSVPIAKVGDQTVDLSEEYGPVIDEIALLKRDLATLDVKDKTSAIEKDRKQLLSEVVCNFEASKDVVLVGPHGSVTFKAASKVRKVKDMNGLIAALKEKVGYQALLQLISISLTEAEKYLGEVELDKYCSETEGPRVLAASNVHTEL